MESVSRIVTSRPPDNGPRRAVQSVPHSGSISVGTDEGPCGTEEVRAVADASTVRPEPDRPIDRLLAALSEAETGGSEPRPTSLRLPEAVHRAAMIATELGMDASLTAATTEALLDRVRRFARGQAIAAHLADFPADEPDLADVALRRVSATEHPAATRPDLVRAVAGVVAADDPSWARSGRVDAAVERVLDGVELVVALGADAA